MRDDRERLLDMLEAIGKIEQYASEESFSSHDDNLVEVWMIHHLQTLEKLLLGFRAYYEKSIPKSRGVE